MSEEEAGKDDLFSSVEIIAEHGVDTVDRTDSDISVVDNYITSNDWCKLLFQDGYMKVTLAIDQWTQCCTASAQAQLKQFALSGELQRSNIRSVCWKLFLGVLPEDQSQWANQLKVSRGHYEDVKKKHLFDPHSNVESSLDLVVHNPLSLDDESPWNQFFQDTSLKEFIQQDIVRTHPEQQFFRQDKIQSSMLNILFCYAKENPHVAYRQGMHELLAPLLFVLHAEDRGDLTSDDSMRPELKVVMDPMYIEHDAFALFTELMEGMQPFYLNAILEADYAMARDRIVAQGRMKHDPRKATPFESKEILAPTSPIARKLDKIHEVILKRADEQLYFRLQHLGIPPQTYGIRWIRLLFSREFLLPSVLELWDAMFVEGTSLSLMDYFFVVMLMQFRDKMLCSDYSSCMQLLMQYPVMFEVPDLVHNSLCLKNPSQFSKPVRVVREWTTLEGDDTPHPLQIQEGSESQETDGKNKKAKNFANKTIQAFSSAGKQMIPNKPIHLPTKLHISVTNKHSSHKSPTQTTSTNDKTTPNQEMVKNPKTRPRALSEVEKVKEQLDNYEAKCLYCGRKMETILDQLQSCIDEFEIPDQHQDTVYLGIAGLKQVRDLLLHKLPFSGELADYESLTEPSRDTTEEQGSQYIESDSSSKCGVTEAEQ